MSGKLSRRLRVEFYDVYSPDRSCSALVSFSPSFGLSMSWSAYRAVRRRLPLMIGSYCRVRPDRLSSCFSDVVVYRDGRAVEIVEVG